MAVDIMKISLVRFVGIIVLMSIYASIACSGRSVSTRRVALVADDLTTAVATTVDLEVRFLGSRESRSMFAIEFENDSTVRSVEADNMTEDSGNNSGSTKLKFAVPDTVRARAIFVRDSMGIRDTIAAAAVTFPLVSGRSYMVMVRLAQDRPYDWLIEQVAATRLRPDYASPAGDTLFLSWGYYSTLKGDYIR